VKSGAAPNPGGTEPAVPRAPDAADDVLSAFAFAAAAAGAGAAAGVGAAAGAAAAGAERAARAASRSSFVWASCCA
jgi:hypothetical protein